MGRSAAEWCLALEATTEGLVAQGERMEAEIESLQKTVTGMLERMARTDENVMMLMAQFEKLMGQRLVKEIVDTPGSAAKTKGSSCGDKTTAAMRDTCAKGGSSSGARFLAKLARLEFSKFTGDDPGVWFPRVE
ncbi:unnamed protein product [Linum trigynum]|uniref:Uncharacterized protein n=1 Tax=Linum trigynum TaxID=586398 RepID=A0AAV2ETV4_9ROSI